MAEELARLGWQEEELLRQRKNAPEKLAIAARLRQETILPLKCIAARVGLPPKEPTRTCTPGCNRLKNRIFQERKTLFDKQ